MIQGIVQRRFVLFLLTSLLVLTYTFPACAQKVLLLPLADISQGGEGLNLELTSMTETVLQQQGIELVPGEDVKRFLAENRIRSYRLLDSYLLKKLGVEFDCSLVLIGTVTEFDKKNSAAGFSFTALETSSGSPIWSESVATAGAEKVRAFRSGEKETLEEIAQPLLVQSLQPLSEIAHQAGISLSRDFRMHGLSLQPGYVKGGEQIEATLKISFLGKRPVLIAVNSVAGKEYLQYDKRTDSYVGKWIAPAAEGRYPVTVELEWEQGGNAQQIENVAGFQVINEPPEFAIETRKGVQIGRRLAVNRHLLILPKVGDSRPLAGWALEIKTEGGVGLVYEEHEGDIPERMVWEGRNPEGTKMASGVYDIVLHVWDLAGNRASAQQRVAFQNKAPKIVPKVLANAGRGELRLHAEPGYEYPLVSWTAVVRTGSGEVLVEKSGNSLPAAQFFDLPEGVDEVLVTLKGEDRLGNRLSLKGKKIKLAAVEKKVEERQTESWVQDF